MASASSTSAKSLFGESKSRLADRVQVNVNNIASVARQIQRGSKSSEILMQSVRNLAQQEHAIDNTEKALQNNAKKARLLQNIKKLELIASHLAYQQESVAHSCSRIEEVKEQAQAMQR